DAKRLGAAHVVISKDAEAMKAQAGTFDLIINTVAVPLDLDPYIAALALNGTMVMVGAPSEPHKSPAVFPLLMGRRSIAGSALGGIAPHPGLFGFCAENGGA